MKYTYPYKLYIFGLVVLVGVFWYGLMMTDQIANEGHVTWPYLLVFTLVCWGLVRFLVIKILFYKTIYIILSPSGIHFHRQDHDILCKPSDVDLIFYARHLQNLKIHHVIHIFKTDGTYFYITNEINHFTKLLTSLHTQYPHHYYEARHVIKGFDPITKGMLFTYR